MAKCAPQIYYQERIDRNNETLKQFASRSRMFLGGRLLFFALAAAACALWLCGWKHDWVWMCGATCFVVYLGWVCADRRARRRERFVRKQNDVLTDELQYLKGVFTHDAGSAYASANHPYATDIDVFGESGLFHRINRTITKAGADRLAQMLSNVGIDKETILEASPLGLAAPREFSNKFEFHSACTILQREAAVSELEGMNDFRLHFQCIGKKEEGRIAEERATLNVSRLKWMVGVSWLLTAASVVLLLLSSWLNIPTKTVLTIFLAVLFANGGVSVLFLRRSGKVMERMNALVGSILQKLPIVRLTNEQKFESAILNEIQTEFRAQKKSYSRLRSLNELLGFRNNALLWLPMNCFAVLDIFTVLQFALWEKRELENLPKLVNAVGQLDALVSLGNYNFNSTETTMPQFAEKGIDVADIKHPFFANEEAVGNDYAQDEQSISIVTGANMSGKSTFLRTIALNLVLANAGCRVFAKRFAFNPRLKLFTSMRTQDNVAIGKSYFNAEIDRLAQAIEYASANSPTLLILDEVLKGTNSEDKLQGTLELLGFFAERNYMAVVATHDIGVTALESKYGASKFKNYCFEIELSDPIAYTYKINRGVCKNRNASYVLRRMLGQVKNKN